MLGANLGLLLYGEISVMKICIDFTAKYEINTDFLKFYMPKMI